METNERNSFFASIRINKIFAFMFAVAVVAGVVVVVICNLIFDDINTPPKH